ncbi:sigma-70 family RNA polymerase sigma factor [Luteimonas sp. M1R5S18]|uniref:Sigma-70 family RNA polymerase sigma factor n=1 Tax=Luteimonas rhizosphaericola TaxID=3042024 RepID=A0ABT6JJR3_9GAMM|nr:sigma-70 family RNA polymerase sigma factor [Luteimonas rhizosphaericola]MDH5830900.1 sigma-70 family RNA polymerase sigma factor [Luteimonas rhizosphaericola]
MPRDAARIYDEYLAASARAGDRAAWERLVARWQPRLERHAWRLTGDPDRARDAVQDAWIEIMRGLRGLDDVVAFPAWALRIVTRRCQRGFGHARREREGLAALAADRTDATAVDEGEQSVAVAQVLAAMRELPAAQRAALALFHLEHLGVAEIAIALDIPPGTVKTRLMHARQRIRARLEGATK